MSRINYNPEVGQRWVSRDIRDRGKVIELTEVPDSMGGFVHAVCVHHVREHLIGRPTRIAYWCLPDYYSLDDS